jgi:hypothetical protein
MRHHMPDVEFQGYEGNPELSGTWQCVGLLPRS